MVLFDLVLSVLALSCLVLTFIIDCFFVCALSGLVLTFNIDFVLFSLCSFCLWQGPYLVGMLDQWARFVCDGSLSCWYVGSLS